jgi:hypothetical protein
MLKITRGTDTGPTTLIASGQIGRSCLISGTP